MPLPPPRKNKVPPRLTPSDEHEFQVNPIFTDDAEMKAWLDKNLGEGKYQVVKTWEVTRIACVVRSKVPRGSMITIKKKEKK